MISCQAINHVQMRCSSMSPFSLFLFLFPALYLSSFSPFFFRTTCCRGIARLDCTNMGLVSRDSLNSLPSSRKRVIFGEESLTGRTT